MNNCKIAIIGINFYPEDSSTGLYTTQMAEFLQKNGFSVSVLTGFPYYPQWEIWKNYKDKPNYLEEKYQRIRIYRYKQFTPKNPTFKNRLRHILSFTFGSLKNLKKIDKTNLVIAIVPFTSDVWLAHKLAKKTNAKVWVHIQDFEFDAAFESGVIRNKYIKKITSKILYKIEKKLLDKSDVVSTISYSMIEKAKQKTKTKLFYFPNWIDEDFINPENIKIHPYLKSKKFKVLYSGNIGTKQDWQFFLEVLKKFKDNNDIEFTVVGDGVMKEWLINNLKNFNNVNYYSPVPYNELSDLLCSADLHILFQKPDVVDTVMPSKLLGMMASGRPSLITGNPKSEVAKIIKFSEGGKFFQSSDVKKIIEFVNLLMKNKNLIEYYGKNARQYVFRYFSKRKVLESFANKLNQIIKEQSHA